MNLPLEWNSGATVHPTPAEASIPLEFSDAEQSRYILGFWIFLSSDIVLFACLFAAFAVYRNMGASPVAPGALVKLGPVMVETLLLLTSSFTCSLALHEMRRGRKASLLALLGLTLVLGMGFVFMEIRDFVGLVAAGYTWNRGSFLSAFYTLVGTHGAHVSFGILWGLALLIQLGWRGVTKVTARKLYTFALYWHFLDLVWIFLFTFVFLTSKAMGA